MSYFFPPVLQREVKKERKCSLIKMYELIQQTITSAMRQRQAH